MWFSLPFYVDTMVVVLLQRTDFTQVTNYGLACLGTIRCPSHSVSPVLPLFCISPGVHLSKGALFRFFFPQRNHAQLTDTISEEEM